MLKKHQWVVLILIGSFFSCTPEEERFREGNFLLRFSADTVLFDTVFTSLGSLTKRVRVFNDNDHAVSINSISLGRGPNSPYNLTVNGLSGNSFEDEVIFGQDSMLILVEVQIDPMDQDLPFIVKDSVRFSTGQDIKLISWGQDAHFLNDSILACNTTWTSQRPYVIFNSILVDSLCTLTVEQGARIFNHNNSSIFIQGTLRVNGTSEDQVIFRNDRLDENFEIAPGQWNGIFFLEGSKNNVIDFAVIENAVFGIWLGTPDEDTTDDLTISNTIIQNISNTGLIAFTSDLTAINMLVHNCGQFSIANLAGGNYTYQHCTFTNFPDELFREQPVMAITDNFLLDDNSTISAGISLSIANSIIWGNFSEELLLDFSAGEPVSLVFNTNLIKTEITALDTANILNTDPLFISPMDFDFHLDSLSPARDAGLNLNLPIDLEGNARDSSPDLGALEFIQ